MERISIDGKNRIIFYGNRVGYISDSSAVIDPQFKNDELTQWLTEKQGLPISWKAGVYDKLSRGKHIAENSIPMLKSCRIWQLKADVDIMIKFIDFDSLIMQFGEPKIGNYNMVYDGELETNDLEEIYTKFNFKHPTGFTGHSLSMSDIVELYDDKGSSFHYVDHFGFKEISFTQPQQNNSMEMQF